MPPAGTRNLLGNVATIVALVCAVVVTGLAIHREFSPVDATSRSPRAVDRDVAGWEKFSIGGHQIGPEGAPVTIVEFGDFECPYCGKFARTSLRGVLSHYSSQVRFVFRHWPLSYHRLAYATARASECAAKQGHFREFFDAIYDRQDSLGRLPIASFAAAAGVPDLKSFTACANSSDAVPAIESDVAAALELHARGTPAVVLNGKLLANSLDSSGVDSLVRDAIGRSKRK